MSQQGALTSWRRQRTRLLNTWKESEPVRGTPSLKRVEGETGLSHAWGQPKGVGRERKTQQRRTQNDCLAKKFSCRLRNHRLRVQNPREASALVHARRVQSLRACRRTSRVSTRSHARSPSAMRARRSSMVVSRLGWVAAINGVR